MARYKGRLLFLVDSKEGSPSEINEKKSDKLLDQIDQEQSKSGRILEGGFPYCDEVFHGGPEKSTTNKSNATSKGSVVYYYTASTDCRDALLKEQLISIKELNNLNIENALAEWSKGSQELIDEPITPFEELLSGIENLINNYRRSL